MIVSLHVSMISATDQDPLLGLHLVSIGIGEIAVVAADARSLYFAHMQDVVAAAAASIQHGSVRRMQGHPSMRCFVPN